MTTMTPAQFYGWSRDAEVLNEPVTPRKETWLQTRLMQVYGERFYERIEAMRVADQQTGKRRLG